MSKKVMPTQIPDEASEAGFQAWTKTAGVNEVIAAAINSWPNVNNNYLAKDNRGAPINAIILPLQHEGTLTDRSTSNSTLRNFDAAEFLKNEEMIDEFLLASSEDENPDVLVYANQAVAKVKRTAEGDILERLRTKEPSYVLIGDAAIEIERLRNLVKELATALEFEANYEPHKALARSALEGK